MRHLHPVSLGLVLGALAIAACEDSYVYRPAVTTTSASVAGRPASYYEIPPEAPRGHVRIATLGFAQIEARDEPKPEKVEALHLRMIVANNSDHAWNIDTREQRAALPRFGESQPAYATSDHGSPPVVVIPPLTERTIDLFYPLPAAMQKASRLPSFDVLWTIDTGVRRVVERTPFERLELEVAPEPYPDYYAWAGPYWSDPYYYGGGAFVGVGGPIFVDRPVVIRHRYFVPTR